MKGIQKKVLIVGGIIIFIAGSVFADSEEVQPLVELLSPQVFETPDMYEESAKDQGDIKAIFYDTLDYKGKPTRAFAYLGIPESDQPVPAMVLVHGGGGKAFHEWVKIWNDRGYAAISMSLEGRMPNDQGTGKLTHEYSGPSRIGQFDDVDKPLEEQWMYHAVADIMLANSLLMSLPEIDADRIGVTGISWGGILSSLVSGVDARFKCAMPVYGAGFLYESKGHFGSLNKQGPELLAKKKFWDPARQFSSGSMPTLWVNGDSDGHFSVNITSRSFEVTQDHAYMTIHPKMRHGHSPGWKPEEVPEIYAFADQIFKKETAQLGKIIQQPNVKNGRNIQLTYQSESEIVEATVYYLNEPLTYKKLNEKSKHSGPGLWLELSVELDKEKNVVKAELPSSALTYYVNLKDKRGHLISSVLVQLNDE